jgi:hypothetical protein
MSQHYQVLLFAAALGVAGCTREWLLNEAIESVSKHMTGDVLVPVLTAAPNPFGEGVVIVGGHCVNRAMETEYVWLMFRDDTYALDEASAAVTPALQPYTSASPSLQSLAGFASAEVAKVKQRTQMRLEPCRP